MQELLLIKDNIVIIQSNDKIYQDTKDNFLKDCDTEILHDNVDYNKGVKRCLVDNVLVQEYPISMYENVINNINDILNKKAKREYVENLPKMH